MLDSGAEARTVMPHIISTLVVFVVLLLFTAHTARARDFPQQREEGANAATREFGGWKYTPEMVTSMYFTNEELEDYLHEFVDRCGHITRVFSIGKSVDGKELWVLEISDHPGVEEPKPNFKFVANIHGNEPSGRQLLPMLAEWLCSNYPDHPWARAIVGKMHLFLLPAMNPDGFASNQRSNRNGIDLNRDFPDRIKDSEAINGVGTEQPETLAVMKWLKEESFVGSAALHEGAVVANYPWDADEERRLGIAASPDDSTFVFLSKLYAAKHTKMHNSKEFPGGITNGNKWYALYGGMQDWNYVAAGCLEITLELSANKNPAAQTLDELWDDNMEAFLAYALATSLGGARGLVKAADGEEKGKPLPARIHVEGIDHDLFAKPAFGDYYRPLAPGIYNMTASFEGYHPSTATIVVPESLDGIVQDFQLRRRIMLGHQQPGEANHTGNSAGEGSFNNDEQHKVISTTESGSLNTVLHDHWMAPAMGNTNGGYSLFICGIIAIALIWVWCRYRKASNTRAR